MRLEELLDRGIRTEFGCLVWPFAKFENGYGKTTACVPGPNRRDWRVHRLSWTLKNGPIPEGLRVLHACDNRPCFEPDHLWLGTDKDNHQDRERKGRGVRLHGENHPYHKLSDETVLEIRRRYAEGNIYQYDLAEEFEVTQTMISKITRRKTRPDLA